MTCRELRRLIEEDEIVYLPHIHQPLVAKVAVNRCGIKAIQHGGSGTAFTRGLPDIGLTSLPDARTDVRRLVDAAGDVPVIADIDDGFGDVLNIKQAVTEMEDLGASGLFFDDQVGHKMGGMGGKKLLVRLQA